MTEKEAKTQKKGNPYRNANIPKDWKCNSCTYVNKETSVPVPQGNCGANEPITEKGCPLYWKNKDYES